MNQKKIGQYIAAKRKSLGLTQVQLAENLGMSNKSVSKWERGVCLPDVSVYMNLCKLLGITVNEFLAGEDIEQAQVETKAEENIIRISSFAKLHSRFFKRIIALLAVLMLLLTAVLGVLIVKEGYFESNYVQGYNEDPNNALASMIGGPEGAQLIEYKVRKGFREINFVADIYKYGKKISTADYSSYITGKEDRKGYLVIAPDMKKGIVNAGVISGSVMSDMEFDSPKCLKGFEYQTSGACSLETREKIKKGKPIELAAYYYQNDSDGDNHMSIPALGNTQPLEKGVTVVFKVTFK